MEDMFTYPLATSQLNSARTVFERILVGKMHIFFCVLFTSQRIIYSPFFFYSSRRIYLLESNHQFVRQGREGLQRTTQLMNLQQASLWLLHLGSLIKLVLICLRQLSVLGSINQTSVSPEGQLQNTSAAFRSKKNKGQKVRFFQPQYISIILNRNLSLSCCC